MALKTAGTKANAGRAGTGHALPKGGPVRLNGQMPSADGSSDTNGGGSGGVRQNGKMPATSGGGNSADGYKMSYARNDATIKPDKSRVC